METPDVVGNLLQGTAVGAGGCHGDVWGKLHYFKRFGLFLKLLGLSNLLSENNPSLSRQFELFAMPAVVHGFSHFTFGDCQALR